MIDTLPVFRANYGCLAIQGLRPAGHIANDPSADTLTCTKSTSEDEAMFFYAHYESCHTEPR